MGDAYKRVSDPEEEALRQIHYLQKKEIRIGYGSEFEKGTICR
jgi:hypothetical protein